MRLGQPPPAISPRRRTVPQKSFSGGRPPPIGGGGVVTGYDLYRNGAKLVTNVTNLNFRDTSVQPDTQYRYRVDARDNATPRNISSKSNTATVTTPSPSSAPGADAPSTPPNVTGKAVSPKKISLWWTSSRASDGGVAGYKVYRDGAPIATVSEASYSDLSVQPNTTYRYRIAAFDTAQPPNTSPQSSAISIRTLANGPRLFRRYDFTQPRCRGTDYCSLRRQHVLFSSRHASALGADQTSRQRSIHWGQGGDSGWTPYRYPCL